VIEKANCTRYGLAAGIVTKSMDIANRVSRSVRAGTVHYRNLALCRVPYSLPSVLFRALGKELFAECHAKNPR
jgi:acyl-CoA reductase-like NAD-dependent aldehyde dehydrogenase